jgi:hypothetical protein
MTETPTTESRAASIWNMHTIHSSLRLIPLDYHSPTLREVHFQGYNYESYCCLHNISLQWHGLADSSTATNTFTWICTIHMATWGNQVPCLMWCAWLTFDNEESRLLSKNGNVLNSNAQMQLPHYAVAGQGGYILIEAPICGPPQLFCFEPSGDLLHHLSSWQYQFAVHKRKGYTREHFSSPMYLAAVWVQGIKWLRTCAIIKSPGLKHTLLLRVVLTPVPQCHLQGT